MQHVVDEGEPSCLLLLVGESVLTASVGRMVPRSALEVADVVLRDEQAMLHLAELVAVVDDQLPHILDAGCDVDHLSPFLVYLVGLLHRLAVDSVRVYRYDITCDSSEKLLHIYVVYMCAAEFASYLLPVGPVFSLIIFGSSMSQ